MFRKFRYWRQLVKLRRQGYGEGDFDGDHTVPSHLLELHEAIEWRAAVEGDEQYRAEKRADPS